jgi:hypothetical protein
VRTTSSLPKGRPNRTVARRGDTTPGRQGAGWERAEFEHLPPGALDEAFNKHRAEFQRLFEALPPAASVDPNEVYRAATELAARCQIAGKMRLFLGARRQDCDAAPAQTARELEQLTAALRRLLGHWDRLSIHATSLAKMVGIARGVRAPDLDHLRTVVAVLDEAAKAARKMRAVSAESVLDEVVEVFCRITGRAAPPVSRSGPYHELAAEACQSAGFRASVTDHARRWVANQS